MAEIGRAVPIAAEDAFYEGPDPCFGGFSVVSTSSYGDQGSRQKGTIHVVRDITERHVAEEKYRLLFEQMQEGVFVATPGGRLLDCNDAFVRILGYANRDELMQLNSTPRFTLRRSSARPSAGKSKPTITFATSKSPCARKMARC